MVRSIRINVGILLIGFGSFVLASGCALEELGDEHLQESEMLSTAEMLYGEANCESGEDCGDVDPLRASAENHLLIGTIVHTGGNGYFGDDGSTALADQTFRVNMPDFCDIQLFDLKNLNSALLYSENGDTISLAWKASYVGTTQVLRAYIVCFWPTGGGDIFSFFKEITITPPVPGPGRAR